MISALSGALFAVPFAYLVVKVFALDGVVDLVAELAFVAARGSRHRRGLGRGHRLGVVGRAD
jgi:hypothetical protein